MATHTYRPANPASRGGSEATAKTTKTDLVPTDAGLDEYATFAELRRRVRRSRRRSPNASTRAPRNQAGAGGDAGRGSHRLHPALASAHAVAFELTPRMPVNMPMLSYEGRQVLDAGLPPAYHGAAAATQPHSNDRQSSVKLAQGIFHPVTVGSGKDTAKAAYGNPSSLLHLLDRLLRPARTTVYPVVILILWPLAWFVMMLIGPDPFMVDFVARWTGGRMAGQGAFGDLYDTVAQMGFQNGLFANENALSWFVGPPFEAVILVPFGALPYPLSTLLWTSASLAALTISLRLLCKQQMPSVINWRRFVIIAFASVPVTELLYSGQNTAFVLLWLVLAQHSIDRDRPFAAGLILGLALVKPHLVALLPTLWLLERRWKALAGLATATACWIVVSIVIVGPTSLLRWLAALQSGLYIGGVHEGQTVKNAGVVGLLTPWIPVTGTAPWESLATVASLAAGLLVILFVWRNTTDPALRWWLVVLATVITAPHAMTYDLVLAIPAIGLAMTRWWTAPIRVSIAITWIAFWIVPAIGLALSPVEWLAQYAATPWHVIPLIVASGVILKQLQSPPICQLQARKVALNPRIPTDPA